jgi:hypothetical protein
MPIYDYKNNAATTTTTVSLSPGTASVDLLSASGFSPDGGKVVVATFSNASESVFEIVHVTSVSGPTATITRAQEGTVAQVWPAGSRFQARLTAGMLDAVDPIKGTSGATAAGNNVVATGADSVAVGSSATSSATGAISVGKSANAQSSGSYAVVIGETAVSNGSRSVVVGQASTADNLSTRLVAVGATNAVTNSASAVVIGSQMTVAAATESVVLGSAAGATAARNVVIGKTASSASTDGVAVGNGTNIDASSASSVSMGTGSDITASPAAVSIGPSNTMATSANAVVIGSNSAADTSANAIAIGNNADVVAGADSIAMGVGAQAITASTAAVVVGAYAKADGSPNATAVGGNTLCEQTSATAIGYQAKARAANSVALNAGETYAEGTFTFGATVPCIQRETAFFWHQGMPNWLSTVVSALSSPPVELAIGQVWATAAFQDNDVVFPTSPAGNEQFYLRVADVDYNTLWSANNTVTEAGTEPTWVVAVQGDPTNCATPGNGNQWIYTNPMTGIDIAVGDTGGNGAGQVMFFPQKIGFICTKYVTNTAAPFVSIGNQSSATAYVNNQQLTGITADNTVHWFPELTSVAGASNIVFKLETAGTGASSRMTGRFIAQGVYMQLPG